MPDASEWAAMVKKKRHKYNVGAKATRTYNGDVYDSMAEAIYAQQLDMLKSHGGIRTWARQVTFPLGPDFKARVDFVVVDWHTTYAVEVKGVDLPSFKKIKKLWRKYGTMALQVMKRRGNRWQISVVPGAHGGSK